jgi:hypothetical protein
MWRDRSTATLLLVESFEAERDVLTKIEAGGCACAGPVAPVLNRCGLPERLRAALEAAGHQVLVRRPETGLLSKPAGTAAPTAMRRPLRIYISPGVDGGLAWLAAALCQTKPLSLPGGAVLRESESASAALVLVRTDATSVNDTAAGLAALSAAGIRIGLVLVADPIEARYAVLKALLADHVAGIGAFALLAPQLPAARAAGVPDCLCDSDLARGPELFRAPHDVLLLSGHATPIDASFGRSLILCGREGAEAAGSQGTAYPCRSDGACFRQRLVGRGAQDREGLVPLTAARSAVLILSGCNVAAIGRSWFDPAEGLAYQAQQTVALAAVVSTSMMSRRLELDLLLLALLAEGCDLATATQTVSRFRTERLQHTAALPPGIGPSLVLGNPNLTVEGIRLQRVAAIATSPDGITLPLDTVEMPRATGALIRVELAHLPAGSLHVTDRPEDVFCLGVVHDTPDGPTPACLYLWLGCREDAAPPRRLSLEHVPPQADAALVATVENVLGEVPFWTVFLAGYVRQARNAARPAAVFEGALAGLAVDASDLCELANALRERPGALCDLAHDAAMQAATWDSACGLSATLLGAVTEIACLFGTVQSHGWDTRLERLGSAGPFGACLCGSGEVWGQRYRMPDGGERQRIEYQCASCGPIGEDDGRRLLRAMVVPRAAMAGATIVCEGVAAAPADRFVLVRACLVLESWMKTDRMVSEPLEALVGPGAARPWTLSLTVPATLPAGVYPVAILAVVNGALTIIRQMLAVAGPAA